MNTEIIRTIDVQSIMTKSSLPVGGYSVNPYVGCPHACKYCYASFMKRFTGHTEAWGTFLDVKRWKPVGNSHKYDGQRIVIGSVTDGYNPYEAEFGNTRRLLEELKGTQAEIMICTKSDLVLRDLDLLKRFPKVTVSWSVNTLDEQFRSDMDRAVSIERRLSAMRRTYEAGIRTVCFVSPIFPGITDVRAIIERVKDFADLIWLENLNLRGQFKGVIMDYIRENHPSLVPLYEDIYNRKRTEYWQSLEKEISSYAAEQGYPYRVNDLPYGRSEKGKPVLVNYFYHEKYGWGNDIPHSLSFLSPLPYFRSNRSAFRLPHAIMASIIGIRVCPNGVMAYSERGGSSGKMVLDTSPSSTSSFSWMSSTRGVASGNSLWSSLGRNG